MRTFPPFVQSHTQGQPGFDLDHYRSEVDWYERHLRAIFRGPCTCMPPDCDECDPETTYCPAHEDTCPACIAEHALWIDRDHPHPMIAQRPRAGRWEQVCDEITGR